MKKAGIFTLFFKNYNYGGVLQALALQRCVLKKNVECEIVLYDRSQSPLFETNVAPRSFLKRLLNKGRRIKRKCLNGLVRDHIKSKKNAFDSFVSSNCTTSKSVLNASNINDAIASYSVFITGSDQVWSPVSGRRELLLSFVPSNKIKFSYAASIGANAISESFLNAIVPEIKKLNAISVREAEAQRILQERLPDQKVHLVLDPTLLLTPEEWARFEQPMPGLEGAEFDLFYFLGENNGSWKQAKAIQNRSRRLITIPYNKMEYASRDFHNGKNCLDGVGPGEFLWLIHHCHRLYTDSFHGVVFALQFHKEFLVFERRSENANGNMSGRIESLLHMLAIDYQPSTLVSPDYAKVHKKLGLLKAESLGFLNAALEVEPLENK